MRTNVSAKICAVAAVCLVGLLAGAAWADGFIVPVHPVIIRPPHPPHPRPIPIRGSWAVKYHHVDIRVRDQVAAVSIDQAFENTGDVDMMEVEYFFPVPPDAAIDSMTLMVDGKEYAAKLLKAEEARKIYEEIVRTRKDPALLEYAGFGLYKTSAFPLRKGKPAKVLVTYKGLCRKDRDLVEVWYPLNTEKFSSKPLESVEVRVDIESKADITAVYSPTHDLDVQRKDSRRVIAIYKAKDVLPIADLQVFYKAADEAVGATLMTHRPEEKEDGYFLLLVSPNPKTAGDKVVSKDVAIVFDHSGSMSGKKIQQAKESLSYVLKNLNPKDRFTVVAYNDAVNPLFSELVDADERRVREAVERMDAIDATGGTNIHEALQTAMRILSKARDRDGRPAYVIFLTDGQPTVGKTGEKDILEDTKKSNEVDARLFAFGVGYDVNVALLDKLVRENKGRSDYVKPNEPIEGKISSLYNKIRNPVMTELKMAVQNLRLSDMYPRELGDLFDGDQMVVVGRYDARDAVALAAAEAGVHHAQLVVKGIFEGRERAFEYGVTVRTVPDPRYAFVEKLWAMRRIGYLLDQIQLHGRSQEVVDEIIRLSMKYGIMTPYTSFLADERTELSRGGEVRREALRMAKSLDAVSGAEGQVGAMNRQALNEAERAGPAAAAPEMASRPGSAVGGRMYGWGDKGAYEVGKKDVPVENVRTFQQQATYRRGDLWVAANAAQLDPDRDKDKIKTVERFSDEYFELVRRNTVGENQILANQQEGEELLIVLRSQAYRIR